MASIGFGLRSTLPAEVCLDMGREAEAQGFDALWVTEGSAGKDAFTLMAALALKTRRVQIASGIVPIYFRTPALAAMSIMAVDELSGGRAILGLGVSHGYIVEDIHRAKLERPLARMREYVEAVRQALRDPQFSVRGGSYGAGTEFVPLRPDVPVYMAVLRPRMARLAGAIADGALLNMAPLSYIRRVVEVIRQGAREAGRDPRGVRIAAYVVATVLPDERQAGLAIKRQIARYAWMPSYNSLFRESGYGEVMDTLAESLSRDDLDEAARHIPDEMARAIGVFGPPEACRRGLDAFLEAGVEHPVVFPVVPLGADPRQALADLVAAFGGYARG